MATPKKKSERLTPVGINTVLPATFLNELGSVNIPAAEPPPPEEGVFINKEALDAPGLPAKPKQAILKYVSITNGNGRRANNDVGEDGYFNVGVYLVLGGTGVGKTIGMQAIVAWANASSVPATYASLFEPRSPTWQRKTLSQSGLPFSDAKTFIDDIGNTNVIKKSSEPKIIACDSINDPLISYGTNLRSQRTFAGGMQPSDRLFLSRMAQIALETNTIFLCAISTALVPYAEQLEGATEGAITILDPREMTFRDRSEARTTRTLRVPYIFVNQALALHGFGTYSQRSGGYRSDYSGV